VNPAWTHAVFLRRGMAARFLATVKMKDVLEHILRDMQVNAFIGK